jgi:hypothetical protein
MKLHGWITLPGGIDRERKSCFANNRLLGREENSTWAITLRGKNQIKKPSQILDRVFFIWQMSLEKWLSEADGR